MSSITLVDEVAGRLDQAPGREWKAVLGRLGLGDLLDLPSFQEGEALRAPAPVLGAERLEAIGVEVVHHVPGPVRACARHRRDVVDHHALRGRQHDPGPPPGHHRPCAPAAQIGSYVHIPMVISLMAAFHSPACHPAQTGQVWTDRARFEVRVRREDSPCRAGHRTGGLATAVEVSFPISPPVCRPAPPCLGARTGGVCRGASR